MTALELPCIVCRLAACEIVPPPMGAVTKYAVTKMMSSGGYVPDPDSPTMGFTAAQLSEILGLRCMVCVVQESPHAL